MKYVLYMNKNSIHRCKSKAQCQKILDSTAKRFKKAKSEFKILKVMAPKYKIGQKLYSYQNETVARKVRRVMPTDDPMWSQYTYILQLVGKSSNYISESSLSKTPIK